MEPVQVVVDYTDIGCWDGFLGDWGYYDMFIQHVMLMKEDYDGKSKSDD